MSIYKHNVVSQLIVNTSSFYNVTNYYYNYTTNYNHLYAKRREGEGGGGEGKERKTYVVLKTFV